MADDLVVSTSGSTIGVASTDLIGAAHELTRVQNDLDVLGPRLGGITIGLPPAALNAAAAPPGVYAAAREIDLAVGLLARASNDCGTIRTGLKLAASAYTMAEIAKKEAIEAIAAQIGYGLGFLLPQITGTLAIPTVVAGTTITVVSGGPDKAVKNLQDWLTENNEVITDPAFCDLLRLAQKSLDDLIAGGAHLPPAAAVAIGDEGTDLAGDDLAPGLIVLGGGALGLFNEGKVSVEQTGTSTVKAPATGLAERIARIPKTDENGGSQIRIDTIRHSDGTLTYEVYISGTQDFNLKNTTTPFDMTSNMRMIGHLPAGSMEAAREALRQAGVEPGDSVIFVGHSQGALLAHELAASGDFDVKGVVEVGAPISGSTLPTGANGVSIAHTDDLVTALGVDRPTDPNQILVERQAFANKKVPHDEAVPAHNRDRYLETAAMADASARGDLTTARKAMDAASDDAVSITSTTYKAVREKKER